MNPYPFIWENNQISYFHNIVPFHATQISFPVLCDSAASNMIVGCSGHTLLLSFFSSHSEQTVLLGIKIDQFGVNTMKFTQGVSKGNQGWKHRVPAVWNWNGVGEVINMPFTNGELLMYMCELLMEADELNNGLFDASDILSLVSGWWNTVVSVQMKGKWSEWWLITIAYEEK